MEYLEGDYCSWNVSLLLQESESSETFNIPWGPSCYLYSQVFCLTDKFIICIPVDSR